MISAPAPVASSSPATRSHLSGVGVARFVDPELHATLLEAADDEGLLSVAIEAPGPGQRGRLGLLVEAAVESALERRGACAPGVAAATDLALSLADQLYRARLVGLRGIALGVGTLGGIADQDHTLDTEDSAVVRYLITAAALHPLKMFMSRADHRLRVFSVPIALADLMPGVSPNLACFQTAVPPAVAPAVARSAAAMQAGPEPVAPPSEPVASEDDGSDEAVSDEAVPDEAVPVSDEAQALAEALGADGEEEGLVMARAVAPPPPAVIGVDLPPSTPARFRREDDALTHPLPAVASPGAAPSATAGAAPSATAGAAPSTLVEASSEEEVEPTPEPPEPFVRGPLYSSAESDWRGWVQELGALRGPKPLSVVERMFVSAYVPLADAVARGIGDESAKKALVTWASAFEQSYKEAFDALRVRGKRPTMVLDVPDIALRIGRLHGARRVELLVVDGMRFDLGVRVEQRLRWRMAQQVALTERLLLWSALPTTSDVQLELLGRGPEALKSWTGEVTSEIPVARGKNARTARRVKVGHRELLKLDLVEASLMGPGDAEAKRLDDLADELAEVLSGHLARLPARTLAVVFGDHGFRLEPLDDGTAAAVSGGASPEEALVPAYAWLVGGVH